MSTAALPVLSDRDLISGTSYDTARDLFNACRDSYTNWSESPDLSHDGSDDQQWPSTDMQRRYFLIVDDASMASLRADGAVPASREEFDRPGRFPDWKTKEAAEPWVVVVDACHDPQAERERWARGPVPGFGRGKIDPPYPGWMRCSRCYLSELGTLWRDLDGDLSMKENLCTRPRYEGQIALYTGNYRGATLIVPEGGSEGREVYAETWKRKGKRQS